MTEDTVPIDRVVTDAEAAAIFETYLDEARVFAAIIYGERPAA